MFVLTICFVNVKFLGPIAIPNADESCNFTLMSDMQPVYLCMNARRAEHKCKWALCYSCKVNQEEMAHNNQEITNNKRRSNRHAIGTSAQDVRKAINAKYDNNMCHSQEVTKHLCRHDIKYLIDFSAKEYFTKSYQEKIESDDISFPIKCVDCGHRISSSE